MKELVSQERQVYYEVQERQIMIEEYETYQEKRVQRGDSAGMPEIMNI